MIGLKSRRLKIGGGILLSLSTFASISLAQGRIAKPQSDGEITAPSVERFSITDDLLAPWRSSACAIQGKGLLEKTCRGRLASEWLKATVVVLYNDDGTVWDKLQLDPERDGYFWTADKTEFVPFSFDLKKFPMAVILRLVGESDHWYKVEINENTRAVKYARKDDGAWSRTTWDGWLFYGKEFRLGPDHEPLKDAPNGDVVGASSSKQFQRVFLLDVRGDWAYVRATASRTSSEEESYFGWIRWRNGRHLLVGCFLNYFEVPNTQTPQID